MTDMDQLKQWQLNQFMEIQNQHNFSWAQAHRNDIMYT